MSGDVQPRKRKDKKRKKDELGVEEVSSRGTAAVFGEGDVFMHSHHEHGTGGHWCAKIIFFSLLAVLVTLIGLIILENRGLTDLEANAVESRYSGVLEGWLEDAPDDDHHDEHTLELKHHEEEEHEEEEEEGDAEVEVERIEREYPDEEPISTELPALPEADDDDDNKALEASQEIEAASDDNDDGDDDDDDSDGEEEFLEAEDEDEPLAVEHISAPPGKPLVEVEEDEAAAWEQPPDSLQQEEEYEQQQLLRNQHHHARHKDGGNSIEEEWSGEPSDAYWRQQLDQAEEALRQEWLD